MTDKARQVTGQRPGESLAHVLNQMGDRRLEKLQAELRSLFAPIAQLTNMLRATRWDAWDAHVSSEKNKLLREINGVLRTCEVTPELFVAHPHGGAPLVEWEYMPTKGDHARRTAIIALCALGRYGLLDRVRQCQRTADLDGGIHGRWFFAKKSDQKYCSRNCQTMPTEERKARKREYARRYHQEEKRRDQLRRPKGAKK